MSYILKLLNIILFEKKMQYLFQKPDTKIISNQ